LLSHGEDLRALDIKHLGEWLYRAIFPGEVGVLFEEALRALTADRRGGKRDLWLRVVIDVHPESQVYWWPLEFLYCKRETCWLAAESPRIALSRRTTYEHRVDLQRQWASLRVLVVMSMPKQRAGEITAQLLQEMAKLTGGEPLKSMEIRLLGKVEGYEDIPGIEYLREPATYDRLEWHLDNWGPHMLHFIGHGSSEEKTKRGFIGLVDAEDEENMDWCKADVISKKLRESAEMRLVLLQGCEGAESETEPGFMNFTENLARHNIPAVVGMGFAISNDHATKFAAGFYEALLRGKDIDQAVQAGRRKIWYKGEEPYFGAPVLFTHSPKGILRPETLGDRP
jgi:hypothetical protein